MASRLAVLVAALAATLALGAPDLSDGSLLIKEKELGASGNATNPQGMDAGGWVEGEYVPPSVNVSGHGMDRSQVLGERAAGPRPLPSLLLLAAAGLAAARAAR